MLKHDEISDVARDLGEEVRARDYVAHILAPTFVKDPLAWEMIVEMMEVVLHRRGFYIAPASRLRDD